MVFFPNCQIELWEYNENEEETNWWGETTPSYELKEIVTCDFQNMSPRDNQEAYGKILQDTYKAYLPIDTHITDTMIIRKVGEKDTYSITGSPLRYDHLIPHIKILLQKQRKPLNLDG